MVSLSQLRGVLAGAMDADSNFFQPIRANFFQQALPGITNLELRHKLRRHASRIVCKQLSNILEPSALSKPQRLISSHLATELNRWG